jgi:hypothetical protein
MNGQFEVAEAQVTAIAVEISIVPTAINQRAGREGCEPPHRAAARSL